MKVDIEGSGNIFLVYNSETHERIDVKHLTLGMTYDGHVEAILYVGVGRLSLDSIPRATDGVREEGRPYDAKHGPAPKPVYASEPDHVQKGGRGFFNPPNTKPVPIPREDRPNGTEFF